MSWPPPIWALNSADSNFVVLNIESAVGIFDAEGSGNGREGCILQFYLPLNPNAFSRSDRLKIEGKLAGTAHLWADDSKQFQID